MDEAGRSAIRRRCTGSSADGRAVVLPSPLGAHGWELAFSPAEPLVYVPTMVMPAEIVTDPADVAGAVQVRLYEKFGFERVGSELRQRL